MNTIISKFDINIHGLDYKSHEYTFEGDDSFFEEYEQDIIEHGTFKVNLVLEKNSTLLKLNFEIKANIELQCDRSLEYFIEEFNFNEKFIFKFGEKEEEINEEMAIIPFGTLKINVADIIFDYITVRVPMKKLLPKFREETERSEDGVMVYIDKNASEEKEESQVDPRWEALLKIKNFNK